MALRIFVAHPSALLTDHRPHGDGLVAFGYVRELAARGHELHVAAQEVDLDAPLPPNVHVHALGASGRLAALGRLDYMWRMRRLLLALQRTTAFDVVHQLNPVDVGITLALADVRLPIVLGPYVPDWPELDGRGSLTRRSLLALKRVLRAAQQRRATTVLLSTPAAATKLEVSPGGPVRVRELSPGIDLRAWPADETGETGQDVLFLARLTARKGIFVLLEAFAQLAAELPAARLLVGGDGPEGEEVGRRVSSSPALRRVELLGHVERERVPATMRACAVHCLPSYGEPFGMSALEAMACAKPVVATDAGGLGYLIDEAGGRKVPPGDPSGLAAALRDVLVDPALGRAMGSHNRRRVEERYSWSRVVDRLEDAYQDAIQQPRSNRRAAGARRKRRRERAGPSCRPGAARRSSDGS